MIDPGNRQKRKGQPGVTRAALFGSCPVCGAEGLWAGPATLADRCRACGTAFAQHDLTGRAAYLVVLPVTVMLVLAALRLDDAVRLPVWALVLLWPPLVGAAVVGALRLAKAAVLVARLRETAR